MGLAQHPKMMSEGEPLRAEILIRAKPSLLDIMIEMILSLVLLAGLAKHGKRRKFRRYIRANIDDFQSFSGLAASTLIGGLIDESVTETCFITSVVCTYSLNKWTPVATGGPLLFGWAHSDYTDSEIEAYVELAGSWDQSNRVVHEISRRQIKIVGLLQPPELATQNVSFRGGEFVKTKLNWRLDTGDTLKQWVYNTGLVAQISTTATVEIHGHANLWPQ